MAAQHFFQKFFPNLKKTKGILSHYSHNFSLICILEIKIGNRTVVFCVLHTPWNFWDSLNQCVKYVHAFKVKLRVEFCYTECLWMFDKNLQLWNFLFLIIPLTDFVCVNAWSEIQSFYNNSNYVEISIIELWGENQDFWSRYGF